MALTSGGLKGGEGNSANVEVTFATEETGAGEIGKIARTTPVEDGPEWLTLRIYGCETCFGDSQHECEDGIDCEPH